MRNAMTTNYKKPWRFECRNDNTATIFLYDMVGSDAFGEGVTAAAFVADLKALGPVDQITVRISSPGGLVSDGVAIFNSLVSHPARIITRVDSMAASISSLIAMAGEQVLMCSNSLLMVHMPHLTLVGAEAGELRRMASVLDKVTENLVAGYARHCKLGSARIREMMTAETWMSAPEALEMGFATEILDEEGDLGAIAACADLGRFKKPPAQLLIAARARKAEPAAEVYYPQFSGRTLQEIDQEHERLRLSKRLHDLKYREENFHV
jgi:ATP-dependent protease ClpP protease subunit